MTYTEEMESIASKHPVLRRFWAPSLMLLRDADRGDLHEGWCVVELSFDDAPEYGVALDGDGIAEFPSEAEAETAVAELKAVPREVVSKYVSKHLMQEVPSS